MTREQIEQMSAGSEMDALIAEKIFGWTHLADEEWEFYKTVERQLRGVLEPQEWRYPIRHMRTPDGWIWQPPRYSTGIEITWRVIEKMREHKTIHDWENIFVELTCWKWFLLSTEAFCLGACRAALIVTLHFEQQSKGD